MGGPKNITKENTIDWDSLAQKLLNEFGESPTDDNQNEDDDYGWWLIDVTVYDMIEFFKRNLNGE